MLGILRNATKVLVLTGLLTSVTSHAFILQQYERDPNRVVQEKHAQNVLLVLGLVSLIPAVGTFGLGFSVTVPLLAGAAVFDGNASTTATINPQEDLANMVSAGVYTASEAQSILGDLVAVNQNYASKLSELGCTNEVALCKADPSTFATVFNLRALTMQYLKNLRGVQN